MTSLKRDVDDLEMGLAKVEKDRHGVENKVGSLESERRGGRLRKSRKFHFWFRPR